MAKFRRPTGPTKSLSDEGASAPEKKPVDANQLSALFVTSTDEINKQYEKQKSRREGKQNMKHRQTFRIADGQEKLVWFPQKEPWLGTRIHYMFIDGRTYHIICTAAVGECPLCDVGHRAGFMALYDMVDVTGYKINSGPNAGTEVKEFHCYYIASDARNTSISKMFKTVPDEEVKNCLITVDRRGSGASTTHIFAIDSRDFEPPDKYIEEAPDFNKVVEDWAPSEMALMEELAEKYAINSRNGGIS